MAATKDPSLPQDISLWQLVQGSRKHKTSGGANLTRTYAVKFMLMSPIILCMLHRNSN